MAANGWVCPTRISGSPGCTRIDDSAQSSWGGPEETTKETAEPGETTVPTTGVWLMTFPAGTVGLGAVEMAPTVRLEALPTVRSTNEPCDTTAPPAGCWSMTSPAPCTK